MRFVGRIFGLTFTVATIFLALHYFNWRRSVQSERAMGQELNAKVCEDELQTYADRIQKDYKIHGLDRAMFLNKEFSRDCLDNPVHIEFSGESFSVTSAGLDRIEGTRDDFSASPRTHNH
jgi:regulatory protein YycI of two-component signal transduction system YycFG